MASRHLLLARWLAVSLAVLTGHTTLAQLWEGNACVVEGRTPGTCKLLNECPSQLERVASSRRFQPYICSFQGTTPLVCCPRGSGGRRGGIGGRGRRPTTTSTTTTTPAPPPTEPVPTSGRLVTMGGEKSRRACQEYSEELSKLPIIHGLIFNGKVATPGEFPHMALLGYRPSGQSHVSWHCGGALISHRFVVTAAHCFTDARLRTPVVVRLGEFNLTTDNDYAVDYRVKRTMRHPNYKILSWYHDLALIELDVHVPFARFVQPACIWDQPEDPSSNLIVTGWGSTQQDGDGSISEVLLKGNGTMNKVSPDVCTGFYRSARLQLRNGVQEGILCAMDPKGSVDTCRGDSGGPIQVRTSDYMVEYYVVGVVSGGSKWCGNRVPSIYTSLHTYIDWIESEVWQDL